MLKFLISLVAGAGTGGLGLLGILFPGVATAIGDVILKYKETKAARENKQDEHAASLGGSWLSAVTEANRSRAEVRKNEGAWGPLGLVTFAIGSAFAYHTWMIVLDSTPFSLFGLLSPHVVGSWGVSTLGRAGTGFDEVERAAIQALFYVAPPAAALTVVAKAFRR